MVICICDWSHSFWLSYLSPCDFGQVLNFHIVKMNPDTVDYIETTLINNAVIIIDLLFNNIVWFMFSYMLFKKNKNDDIMNVRYAMNTISADIFFASISS